MERKIKTIQHLVHDGSVPTATVHSSTPLAGTRTMSGYRVSSGNHSKPESKKTHTAKVTFVQPPVTYVFQAGQGYGPTSHFGPPLPGDFAFQFDPGGALVDDNLPSGVANAVQSESHFNARSSAQTVGHGDHANRGTISSASNNQHGNLDNSTPSTRANKESNGTTNNASTSLNFSRDVSCDDAEMGDCSRLNFAAAPPLSFGTASAFSSPPPLSSYLAKLTTDQADFAIGDLKGIDRVSAGEDRDTEYWCSETGASNFYRPVTENATTENTLSEQDFAPGQYSQDNNQFSAAADGSEKRFFKLVLEAKTNAQNTAETSESANSIQSIANCR